MRDLARFLGPGRRLPFHQFMDLALYHPTFGYYEGKAKTYPPGPRGDFITAPTLHPAFGATLGALVRELAASLGMQVLVADVGAGDGSLLQAFVPLAGEGVVARLVAVERSSAGRALISQRCPKVELAASLEQITPLQGPCVVFASELYDAMPFHVVEQGERELSELYVEVRPDLSFAWVPDRPSTDELALYLARFGVTLLPGQRAEIRLQAEPFHRQLLTWAGEEALVLVIDYGYPAKVLYNPKGRFYGSLVGYRRQRLVFDVLKDPGEVDITAHVNWDDLLGAGRSLGFSEIDPEPLGLFLVRWGLLDGYLHQGTVPDALQLLVHPAGMGSDLKVLAQGKGSVWRCFLQLHGAKKP
ncbi:MAG: SAM-dependent methyltransferase [Thermoanaerobaculaceae bacterium]